MCQVFDPVLGYTRFIIGSMVTVLTKRIGQKQPGEASMREKERHVIPDS